MVRSVPSPRLVTVLAIAVTTAVASLAPRPAAAQPRYFHLIAEDLSNDGERVSINVPFSIVRSALALLPYDEIRRGGELRVNGEVMSREELRTFWNAVKAAREGEPVEIVLEEGRRHRGRYGYDRERQVVRLMRKGGALSIHSTEDDGERVEILLPARFVDVLLDSGEESFTLDSVVRAFAALEEGSSGSSEAIRIDSDDARVRIWVDGDLAADGSPGTRR